MDPPLASLALDTPSTDDAIAHSDEEKEGRKDSKNCYFSNPPRLLLTTL